MSARLVYSSKLSWNTITSVPGRNTGSPDGSVVTTVIAALPLCPSPVAVIVAAPSATPATSPLPFTVATAELPLAHVTTRPPNGLPFASFGVAVSCSAWPTWRLAAAGPTATAATGAGSTIVAGSTTVVALATLESAPNTALDVFSVPRNATSWNW